MPDIPLPLRPFARADVAAEGARRSPKAGRRAGEPIGGAIPFLSPAGTGVPAGPAQAGDPA
jgi:hypothetical protein